MLNRLLGYGPTQVFKGLREGNIPILALGAFLLAVRFLRRGTKPHKTSFTLKEGESVTLRISRDGDEDVSYRIDA